MHIGNILVYTYDMTHTYTYIYIQISSGICIMIVITDINNCRYINRKTYSISTVNKKTIANEILRQRISK